MSDTYNYDEELDDGVDTLQFGKYATLTPLALLNKDPHYLIWCWEKTTRWCGSEELIKRAYKQCGMKFKQRNQILKKPPETHRDFMDETQRIAEFEQAVYDTYGCFPKPTYIRS